MARILCAWEFGGDLGHIQRLLPIARELRRLGHEAALAFRDLARLGPYAADGFEWFQAPHTRLPDTQNPSPLSPTDVLLNLGYADAAGLAGALRGWRALLALWKPALVVCDYAPGAILAARMQGIPTVTVGNGFSLPPPDVPLAAYRPWDPVEPDVLRRLDGKLLATVARAYEMLRAASPPLTVHPLFAGDAHLVCNFAELDPLGPRAGVEYSGPIADSVSEHNVAWKTGERPRIFAYLKPRDPRFAAIVAGLRQAAGESIVVAAGLTETQVRDLSSDRVRVFPHPVNLAGILETADFCVAHGGTGFTARSMLAGVPLALIPMQLEQFRLARRLEAAVAAAMISPDDPAPDFTKWFSEIAARTDLREGARAISEAHRGYDFTQAAAHAAKRIAAAVPG